MPNFSPYCFVYNNNSNNNNNNSKYCNNYTTANKFLFIVLLLNIFVFSSTVTSSNVFQHTTETIEKCLIEDKDDLCLISRKNEFYYRWCNLETVERIHMTEYGVPEERQTPWLVIGRYAEEPSNANTQFFFNGRLCPNSPDPYHAEVTFTCCPKERKRDEILSIDEIRPCLYIMEVCTSCHCEESSINVITDRENKEAESTWSVKSEKRVLRQLNDTGGFAQIINQDEILDTSDVEYDDDLGLNDEINEIYQMIDEEMEFAKQEKQRQENERRLQAQKEEAEKFDIKQDEANGKAEEGEKQRKLEEDKVKHNRHVEQKRKRDKQGEEKTKMEERNFNENDSAEGKLKGTRNLRDLVNNINLENLRNRVKRMFYHGYKNYMSKAFPMDELSPISCAGSIQKQTGGSMLTLIDTLDTLVVLGDYDEFVKGVRTVSDMASYKLDQNISVFETNIRILGGLLSAHILALDRRELGITEAFLNSPPHLPYDGKLLDLALDLGDRLIPAFETKTGIPYGTVNLMKGVPPKETSISSLAGAGTLYLELGLLSSLSRDPKYAEISRRGMVELFSRRNKKTDLFGAHIDTKTGSWTEAHAGIGSNADSFYEYLLKCYILFDDVDMFYMFREAYDAVLLHLKQGPWYRDAQIRDGGNVRTQYNNLQAFWPGLQMDIGHVSDAVDSLNVIHSLWRKYGFTPEHYDWQKRRLIGTSGRREYPLRPEMIESIYHVHEYFKSHGDAAVAASWIEAGKVVLEGLETTRVNCGYAAVKNVETKELEDNMPSFFLSETLKYLYLLFDSDNNPFSSSAIMPSSKKKSFVFSTEAHIFDIEEGQRINFIDINYQPKVYAKKKEKFKVNNAVFESVLKCHSRPWWERAELIFNAPGIAAGNKINSGTGRGKAFLSSLNSGSSSSSNNNEATVHEMTGSPTENGGKLMHLNIPDLGSFDVEAFPGGFQIRNHNDNLFLEIANLGGEPVMISEGHHFESVDTRNAAPFTKVSNWYHYKDGTSRQCYIRTDITNRYFDCSPSAFGEYSSKPFELKGIITKPIGDKQGCNEFAEPTHTKGKIVYLDRGGCLFEEKVLYAQKAGAIGVIIGLINKDDKLFIMAGIEASTGLVMNTAETITEEGFEGEVALSQASLSAEEVKEYERDLAVVKKLIDGNDNNEDDGKQKIGEGIKTLIVHLVNNLKSDKIPMKAKKNVVSLALRILSLDPSKPLTPNIYSEIMEGIKATQVHVNLGKPGGSESENDEDDATRNYDTKIPVIQVSFQSARQIKSLINAYAAMEDRPVITIANQLPNNIPKSIRSTHTAVLKGNVSNIDLLTRGEWGVNLNLKENEWQLGITKRVGNVDPNP